MVTRSPGAAFSCDCWLSAGCQRAAVVCRAWFGLRHSPELGCSRLRWLPWQGLRLSLRESTVSPYRGTFGTVPTVPYVPWENVNLGST